MYGAVPLFYSSDLMPAEASGLCSGGLVTSVSSQVGKTAMGHNQDGKAWPTTRKITGHGDEKWTDQKRKEKRARFSRKGLCGRFFSWPSFIGFGGLFCFSSDDFIDTILDQESANCPHQRMLEGCCSCVPVSNNDYWRVSAPASRPS